MKHFFRCILKSPMIIAFILITIIYGLPAFGKPAQIDKNAVATAVGVDRLEGEEKKYEISLLTFLPIADQTFKENYKVISGKGDTISEALDYAGLQLGRRACLSHVKLVVLSENLFDEQITNDLDYFTRSCNLTSSTKIIACSGTVKDFLEAAQKLDTDSSLKISDTIIFNQEYLYALEASFETFFKGMFGPTKVSLLPYLVVQSQGDMGLQVALSDSASQPQGQENGQGSQQKKIVNNGDCYVFKDGKLAFLLPGEQVQFINILNGNFETGSIKIGQVYDKSFQNANLNFKVLDAKMRYKVCFENDIPVVYMNLKLNLKLDEVETDGEMVQKNVEFFELSQSTLDKIETKVKDMMAQGIAIMRDNQTDIVDFYTLLHNSDKQKFEKFLDSLQDPENYLSHIVFKSSVRVTLK